MRLINPYLDLFKVLESESALLRLSTRKKLVWAYAWAVPNDEAIAAVAALSPLVELGAGTGYWAWLLGQAGARVTPYDVEPDQPPRWCEIREGGPESLGAHSDESLFLCWPPLDDPMASEALAAFRGKQVAYVGEPRGGRTADDGFFDLLERDFVLEREIALPAWPGFQDRLTIHTRRSL